jgi:protein-S-isoprenylcysteine O-methyltransferase Ste14
VAHPGRLFVPGRKAARQPAGAHSMASALESVLKSAARLLVGILIFVGLPLLAWGMGDLRGFAGNPARLAYVVLMVLLQGLVVILIPEAGGSRGKGRETVGRQRVAVILMQILSLAIVFAAPFGDRRDLGALGESMALRCSGLILLALGFFLAHWAEASLGRLFSIQVELQENHRLVTEGPFRLLRHPRYAGLLLSSAGFALAFRSWTALLLMAPLSAVLLWRIRDEEALMHRTFGLEWEEFARRTWRLIPFIY